MVSPVSLDLGYVGVHDKKKAKNIGAIRYIESIINITSDAIEEARLINKACLQFEIISRRNTEARTYSWARIGCLIAHVREHYEQTKGSHKDIPSWSKFAEIYFNKTIGERRIEQAQVLYNYELTFKDIAKIYYLGIDRIVPLFNALYLNGAQGQVKQLLEKFDINLKDRAKTSQEMSALNKKIDALTKYLNTTDTVCDLSYNKDLMFRAIRVGCVFDKSDAEHMRSLASSEEIDNYLLRCIANKGFNRVQDDDAENFESIHCILSKLIETMRKYRDETIPVHHKLDVSRVDEGVRCLNNLSRAMHKKRSK